MVGAWKRAISHAIVVHILIASKSAEPSQVFRAQYFAAIQWFVGISEWPGHPAIHAQIKVGHDKNRCLQLLSQVERCLRPLVTFPDAARNQHDVLRVPVRQKSDGEQVALLIASWHARGRTRALYVEDHPRQLGVVA